MKYLYLCVGFLLTSTFWAHEPIVGVNLDSVSVVMEDNEQFILHEVLSKQTLYTIANAYGISVSDIFRSNPELRDRLVKVQEVIYVPLTGMEIIPTITKGTKAYYRVQPKETIFRLARVYFSMEMDHLRRLNNLDSDNLDVGQKLLLGTLRLKEKMEVSESIIAEGDLYEEEFRGMTWREEKSIAYWLRNEELNSSLFVLHNEAPINSLVEIINPMYDRKIMAKVVGRIPEGAYTKDIDVIISNGLANELGAIDPRFYVKVKYLK